MLHQQNSRAVADPDREHFARHGYVLVPQLTEPPLTKFLLSYIHTKYDCGLMTWGDRLVPMTPSAYGDSATDGLLGHIQPRIEAVTGLTLIPTYSYLRLYKNGDQLLSHRDRPACEISLSLNLGQTPDEPWPIFVEGSHGPVEVALKPGDALLYRGIDLFHWREPYAGQEIVQVFLHYVDANGPHTAQKYDGRPSLMLPPRKQAPQGRTF